MSFTQTPAAGGSRAPHDPTLGSTEHRILGPEFQDVAAELATDLGHQLAQQPRRTGRLQRRRGHSCTCPPVNQPTCSMARRAVLHGEVFIRRGRGHMRVSEHMRDDLDADSVAQQPGRGRVSQPVRVEVDPGLRRSRRTRS
jgi:hypothetical protein